MVPIVPPLRSVQNAADRSRSRFKRSIVQRQAGTSTFREFQKRRMKDIQIGWTREPPPPDRAVPIVPVVPPLRSVQNVTAAQRQFNSSNVQLFDAPTMSGVFCKPSSRWGNLDVSRTSRSIESTTYAGLSYFGSGIPSWRQILRARRSAISMCRGTVVTRRGSARLTYLLCFDRS